MAEFNYVPVLKTKAGELDAFKHLTAKQKKKLCPLLEVQPASSIDQYGVRKS